MRRALLLALCVVGCEWDDGNAVDGPGVGAATDAPKPKPKPAAPKPAGGPRPDIAKEVERPKPIEITARELWKAYDSNEIAADRRLRGKELIVSGRVDSIATDVVGDPYVSLKVGYFDSVQCMFASPADPDLSTLRKGSDVSLRGVLEGQVHTIPLLRSCSRQAPPIAELEAFADRMCACVDRDCATPLDTERRSWLAGEPNVNYLASEKKPLKAAIRRYDGCLKRATRKTAKR